MRRAASRLHTLPSRSQIISRSYSLTSIAQSRFRAPALADITPESAASFDARQREFRERLVAEQNERKRKEQAESQCISISFCSRVYDSTLTTATGAAQDGGGKRKGPLSSLIYGTEEGRELEKDIERSFSQVLARGKYVHSIVFHEVKPDKVDEYVELIGGWYPYIAGVPEHKVHLVGSWRTEVGDCDTFGRHLTLTLNWLECS
jgi:hypothetical protein